MNKTETKLKPIKLTNVTTLSQHRAFRFVEANIKDADASQWSDGYIHGQIQALTMTGSITADQARMLEAARNQTPRNRLPSDSDPRVMRLRQILAEAQPNEIEGVA